MKKFNIDFIEVNEGKLTIFESALHKQLFINTHKEGTYRIIASGNAAVEDLYILVDCEGTGYCLTPKGGITYNEAMELLKHYL